jgi:glycerophosphoryl diester phosphodiesterase
MSSLQKIFITAHRGASGQAPENTLASVRAAIEIGADYSEVDVHLTRDEELVLLHDDRVDRTTDGTGYIWDFDATETMKLDAGSWFSAEYQNETIPTLSEVMQLVKPSRMKLNIEVKFSSSQPSSVEKLIALIRVNQFEPRCIITSFDQKTVAQVIRLAPGLKSGLILNQMPLKNHFSFPGRLLSVHHIYITAEIMDLSRTYDKEIHAWTVNEKADMERLARLGVHNIITNFPDRAKQILSTVH